MTDEPGDVSAAAPRLLPRVVAWSLVTLAILCLLAVGAWSGGRWWLRSKLDKAPLVVGYLSGRTGGSDRDWCPRCWPVTGNWTSS